MLKKINEYFKRRKEAKEKAMFKSGYNWVTGLIETGHSPRAIALFVQVSKDFKEYNSFDKGVEQALQEYTEKEEQTQC